MEGRDDQEAHCLSQSHQHPGRRRKEREEEEGEGKRGEERRRETGGEEEREKEDRKGVRRAKLKIIEHKSKSSVGDFCKKPTYNSGN